MLDALAILVALALWMPIEVGLLTAWGEFLERREEAERARLLRPLGLREPGTNRRPT